MPTEKQETITYYTIVCADCGQEVKVSKNYDCPICTRCATKRAIKVSKELLSNWIGAKIISVKPMNRGIYTENDEIESIEIETTDGKRINLYVGGWEDPDFRYIEWRVIDR